MSPATLHTDAERVIERLQNWMRGVDALVLGSGASADYEYPLMSALANHLLSSVNPEPADQASWSIIEDRLRSNTDLETSMADVQLSEGLLELIVGQTWNLVSRRDLEFYNEIISGRSDFPLSDLVSWLDTAKKRIDIITTNYDRVVEYACDKAGIAWIDGTGFGHIKRQIKGFETHLRESQHGSLSTVARVWKVHGSLDWFSHQNTDAFLATPLRREVPGEHIPLVVIPGQTKYAKALSDPFRSILTGSDEVIRESKTFVCVGYGFNDRHVHEKLIEKSRDNHSKFVVLARTLTPNTRKFLIENGCRNYIAIERGYDDGGSLVWLSGAIDPVTVSQNIWSMRGLCSVLF